MTCRTMALMRQVQDMRQTAAPRSFLLVGYRKTFGFRSDSFRTGDGDDDALK